MPMGLLTVNDIAAKEPYLYPGDKLSDSADSRAHLGDPGGGTVRIDDVIGRAGMVYWPPSRAGVLGAPSSLPGMSDSTAVERHR
jgi:signal peptidase I